MTCMKILYKISSNILIWKRTDFYQLYMLLLVHSHTSTLTPVLFLSDQVLTVIPVVSLELGRRLLTSSRGVMDIRGQIGPVCWRISSELRTSLFLTLLHSTYCSDPELIYLTDGASKGVMQMLNAIIRNERDGVWLFFENTSSPKIGCYF